MGAFRGRRRSESTTSPSWPLPNLLELEPTVIEGKFWPFFDRPIGIRLLEIKRADLHIDTETDDRLAESLARYRAHRKQGYSAIGSTTRCSLGTQSLDPFRIFEKASSGKLTKAPRRPR